MAWEATHLLPLVLLVLLASGSWEQQRQPELIQKWEGEEVFLRCNYLPESRSKTKAWCRVTGAGICNLLVTSPRSQALPGNPRYVIRDFPRQRYFTVTMAVLREKDSGLYWCGTLEFSGIFILRAIRLVVSPASTLSTTRPTSTTRTTRTTAWTFAASAVIDSSPSPWNVIISVMVVLLLLLVLALLVFLYLVIKARQQRRARAGEGKAHHIRDTSAHEDETVHRSDPSTRQRDSPLSWGSDQQIGSGKDTGDIHYASFTHLEPFGIEDPIYVNTRPGLNPTNDPFLVVEYASITKNSPAP